MTNKEIILKVADIIEEVGLARHSATSFKGSKIIGHCFVGACSVIDKGAFISWPKISSILLKHFEPVHPFDYIANTDHSKEEVVSELRKCAKAL